MDQLGFSETLDWEDIGEIMTEEDELTRARLRSYHQELIQQQQYRNWKDVMVALFPVYLHLKRKTRNWTLPCAFDNFSSVVCSCPAEKSIVRQVDLVDLMGQKRVNYAFCPCTPDPVHLLTCGYLASTPVFPQTAFSMRLLNFYDLMWNICNAHISPFTKVMQRWNESISVRLYNKLMTKPRDLRRNLSASIHAHRSLMSMRRNLVQSITSVNKQDLLAQRSCPACFGVSLPIPSPTHPDTSSTQPIPPSQPADSTAAGPHSSATLEPPSTQPPDDSTPEITNSGPNLPASSATILPSTSASTPPQPVNGSSPPTPLNQQPQTSDLAPDDHQVFICFDANFQQRHHERATKNYLELEDQPLFIRPEEIVASNAEILDAERSQRVSKKAKDRCTEQHKAADDRRNAASWKGCDDTGLFGCCCRHDAVIYFCNIHKTGEGRGLPLSILNRIFAEINPNVKLGILYDIGCTLKKFLQSRALLGDHTPRMKFATAVFHSYVHDWPCQLQYNPRYNEGWGLTDGEGLERLWSYLSPLVSPLRYATRNHRIGAINHRSFFHNELGMEKLVVTLKRKTIHAMATKVHSERILCKLYLAQNPHQVGQFFTDEFFRAQWQRQRDFEINRNQADREKKEEQAQFFERGEAMKSLAELFVTKIANPSPQSDSSHALRILQEIRDLQKEHDEECKKLGSYFVVEAGTERNSEKEKRLALLWSAKTALYKCAVQIQGETQPLRATKTRADRLGTVLKEKIFEALKRRQKAVSPVLKIFCDRRTDYLTNHAPDLLSRPENKPIDYKHFKKIQLDDAFWNDGYMCMSKDPWALDPTVRTGIHTLLRLDRANEELVQLTNELRRTLSWGIHFQNQLKHRINQCVLNTVDAKLQATLEEDFGVVSWESRSLVSDELESVQTEHEKMLLAWHTDVEEIATLGFLHDSTIPREWSALVEFLKRFGVNDTMDANIDLLLEETVLENQESDGESDTDDADAGQDQGEHVLPDDDD
ncbi:hypothetical protein PSTG_13260 [Puccinia striiformis f. sp. tritici PST-78]|uniref:CxC1-like cysteine cluster associated with KDZ transposases domain-containing protein n=1 Tax=Puccinia striiformis f. sp. tritici PST-78 TaxID=1165861 RepID=A0A0L0V2B0_9BASI|nr:hypothetical protein PSTG_13260 [Puccinia striiformis f. sp. tritici PST-78]